MSDLPVETVELRTYVRIFRRRRAWIALGIALGIAISVARAQGEAEYASTALILLQARGIDAAGLTYGQTVARQGYGGTGYVGDLYQATIILRSKVMRDRVEKRLGYPALATTAALSFTDLIAITATTASPKKSADVANAFAKEYSIYRREQTEDVYNEAINSLNAAVTSLRRQADALQVELAKLPITSPQAGSLALLRATYLDSVQNFESRASALEVNSGLFAGSVQVVEPAFPPTGSTAPTRREQLKSGLLLGAVLAAMFVAVVEFFDRRALEAIALQRSADQPILSAVPRILRWRLSGRPHLGLDGRVGAPAMEAYRSLRSSLIGRPTWTGVGSQVILFNAERPRAGTSTTVLNLAHLFAAGGRSTLLLDLDAHQRASSAASGQAATAPGFAEFVAGAALTEVITAGRAGLSVMGPGQMTKTPAEFLAEPRVATGIDRLRSEFEVILIDSPALQQWTDALSFSALADAVVVVCRLGRMTEEELDAAFLVHERAGANVAGTIVTNVRRSRAKSSRRFPFPHRRRAARLQPR